MRRSLLPLLLVGAVLPGAPAWASARHPAHVPPRVVTLHYYGASTYYAQGVTWNDPNGGGVGTVPGDGGVGGVQFPLMAGDTSVSATTSDATGHTAGGGLTFYDGSGKRVGQTETFCGQLPTTKIPVGATAAHVYLDVTVCPGLITRGTVTATIGRSHPLR